MHGCGVERHIVKWKKQQTERKFKSAFWRCAAQKSDGSNGEGGCLANVMSDSRGAKMASFGKSRQSTEWSFIEFMHIKYPRTNIYANTSNKCLVKPHNHIEMFQHGFTRHVAVIRWGSFYLLQTICIFQRHLGEIKFFQGRGPLKVGEIFCQPYLHHYSIRAVTMLEFDLRMNMGKKCHDIIMTT